MNRTKVRYSSAWSAVFAAIALLAVASLFWFIKAHHVTATSAGWGDQAQDRHHALLGWKIILSAAVAVAFTMLAAHSRRVLLALIVGATVSGLAVLIGPWLPWVGGILGFPGILAGLYTFGIHSGGSIDYAFTVNTIGAGSHSC